MNPDRPGRLRRLAARTLPLWAALAIALPHLLDVEGDPDLWWHVRTGELILEEGALPETDPFSFTAAGAPWVNHEWAADVVFAGAFRLAGGRGLVALRALLLAGTLALLAALVWERSRHPIGTVALLAAAAGTVSFFANLRPHSFTWLLTLAFLAAADAHRRGSRRALWWWPPLMVLWANLHGGFVLGLAVAGLGAAALLVRRDAPAGEFRRVLAPALATLAAPLLNPYGPALFAYLVRELGADHSLVSEWVGIAAVRGRPGPSSAGRSWRSPPPPRRRAPSGSTSSPSSRSRRRRPGPTPASWSSWCSPRPWCWPRRSAGSGCA